MNDLMLIDEIFNLIVCQRSNISKHHFFQTYTINVSVEY